MSKLVFYTQGMDLVSELICRDTQARAYLGTQKLMPRCSILVKKS